MKQAINIVCLSKPGVRLFFFVTLYFFFTNGGLAQLSPGDLTQAHAHLEGMSNCTQCHILGQKVANEKCLACHKPLKKQIDQKKGYHSSSEISGRECTSCHSEHHGRKFQMIRFDKENFKHSLTGYDLLGAHQKLQCEKCHKADFISDKEIKKKKNTFLGLNTNCLNCHDDYHQNTLSVDCKTCHNFQKFKPAAKFNHDNTKFHLAGKHRELECVRCHKLTSRNGQQFQEFSGIAFASCTDCHKDVHDNKFGQNCTKCHNEQSFHVIKSMSSFNHDQTNFKLVGKHRAVDCKKCHKTKFTDHLSHTRCTDCHADYHQGQFTKEGITPDCSDCHNTTGFADFSFSIEKHNNTGFILEGAHLATPCFACHQKKEDKWDFNIDKKCSSCHNDIHQLYIDKKYYPGADCEKCHTVDKWASIQFDHTKTGYELSGRHRGPSCRDCHFETLASGQQIQRFSALTGSCTECHTDKHFDQFEVNGKTECLKCHDFNDWKAGKFDHNKTRFPLDGKHINVACSGCHKEKQKGQVVFIQYKLNEFRCENCH